ncbi:hypothetical protein [Bosea sp. RAC05]|uniref:hypothetical protein n=1 Tax=Bosea sp. RAC05 TaxID=1842539 RepID=UPI00083E08D5|nr:hypothetical protein [Bosea sp. RAC05]AOG03081.1 hypothetical protein BSY19_4907 [Bosea sp. RAC05]
MTNPNEPPALTQTQVLANLAAERAFTRLAKLAADGVVIADEGDFVDREITAVLKAAEDRSAGSVSAH